MSDGICKCGKNGATGCICILVSKRMACKERDLRSLKEWCEKCNTCTPCPYSEQCNALIEKIGQFPEYWTEADIKALDGVK